MSAAPVLYVPADLVLEQPLVPPLPPLRGHGSELVLLRLGFGSAGIGSSGWISETYSFCARHCHLGQVGVVNICGYTQEEIDR
jgi:hypothetical protein